MESFVLYCVSDNGTVYAGGRDKALHAIRDGKEIWTFEADSGLSKPCVSQDGTVYVGSGHTLHALRDGKEIWRAETGSLFGIADPGLGPDRTVYAGNYEGRVVAVKEGKELWRFETGREVKSAPLVGPDGTVYVGNRGGHPLCDKRWLVEGKLRHERLYRLLPGHGR